MQSKAWGVVGLPEHLVLQLKDPSGRYVRISVGCEGYVVWRQRREFHWFHPISLISTQAWKRVRTHFRMHAPDSTCWYALSTILGSIVHGLGYVHRSLGRTFHALTWWHWDALGAKNWASGEQGELCVQMYGQMFVFFVWWCRKVGVEQTPYEKHRKNCRNIEHEIFGLLDADPTLIPGKIKSDLASKESNVCVCVTVCSPSNWLGHCV